MPQAPDWVTLSKLDVRLSPDGEATSREHQRALIATKDPPLKMFDGKGNSNTWAAAHLAKSTWKGAWRPGVRKTSARSKRSRRLDVLIIEESWKRSQCSLTRTRQDDPLGDGSVNELTPAFHSIGTTSSASLAGTKRTSMFISPWIFTSSAPSIAT